MEIGKSIKQPLRPIFARDLYFMLDDLILMTADESIILLSLSLIKLELMIKVNTHRWRLVIK